MFSRLKTKSKSGLRADAMEAEHPSLRMPPPPVPDRDAAASFLPVTPLLKRKKPSSQPSSPENEFTLDTNIDHMEGIINLDSFHTSPPPSAFPSYAHSLSRHSPPSLNLHTDFSSPSSGFDSSSHLSISLSDNSSSFYSTYYSPVTSADFSNPFLPVPATTAAKRKGIQPRFKEKDRDKRTPTHERPLPPVPATIGSRWPDTTDWLPPESWAVEKVGDDADELAAGESSSSEDSGLGLVPAQRRISAIPPHTVVPNGHAASGPPHPPHPRRRRSHVTTTTTSYLWKLRPSTHPEAIRIRIYRANNAFHIATIASHVTVANLTPALNEKLLQGKDVETHRLYLKERGRGGFCFFSFFLE
jgi:adenylate cyclase